MFVAKAMRKGLSKISLLEFARPLFPVMFGSLSRFPRMLGKGSTVVAPPPPTRAPDIVQPSPYYQRGAWALRSSECIEAGGTHIGCGCLRLQVPWEEEGTVARK